MTRAPAVLTASTDLASGTTAERFDGESHGGGIELSFFINHTPPGAVIEAHRHPYAEVFVIRGGRATFTVDGADLEAGGGQVVVVPPEAWHGFANTGEAPLEMLSLHPAAAMRTEWQDAAGS